MKMSLNIIWSDIKSFKDFLWNIRRGISVVLYIDLGLKFVMALYLKILFVCNLSLNLTHVYFTKPTKSASLFM